MDYILEGAKELRIGLKEERHALFVEASTGEPRSPDTSASACGTYAKASVLLREADIQETGNAGRARPVIVLGPPV